MRLDLEANVSLRNVSDVHRDIIVMIPCMVNDRKPFASGSLCNNVRLHAKCSVDSEGVPREMIGCAGYLIHPQ